MIRRFAAAFIAFWFFYLSAALPARAFVFVAAALLSPEVMTSGGIMAIGALAGAVGIGGLYLTVKDSQGNEARIPLADTDAAKPPAPDAAPSVAPQTKNKYFVYAYSGDSPSAACDAYVASGVNTNGYTCFKNQRVSGPDSNGCYVFSYASGAPCVVPAAQNYPCYNCSAHAVTNQLVSGCPIGYSLSGATCVLTNPRRVTPDKKCDLTFSAGKYMYYDDADCPDGPTIDHSKAVPGLRSDGDIAFVWGKDANGNDLLVKVLQQRGLDGQVAERALEVYRKRDAANVDVTSIKLAPDAKVKSVTQSVQPGQMTSPATSPTAASTPDSAATTPTAQTDPTKQPSMVFPDDYARENTAQSTKSGIDQLHRDLTDTTVLTDPSVPTSNQFSDSFFNGTFNALTGWQLPSHSSQCPTGTFNVFGQSYVLNSHCTLISGNWGALQAAMGVVWSLMALFIVLRA